MKQISSNYTNAVWSGLERMGLVKEEFRFVSQSRPLFNRGILFSSRMQSGFFKFVFSLWSSFKNYWQSPSNIRDAKCWNAFSFSGPKFSYQFWLATTWTTCESIKLRCNRMKDEVLWLRIFPANPCLRNKMYCISLRLLAQYNAFLQMKMQLSA